MGYTDQRLYRAQGLEPIAAIGDVLYLLDQSGPLQSTQKYPTPFFAVNGIEPVEGLAPHNIVILYTSGAAAPAGYGTGVNNTQLIAEAVSNQQIAAGASVQIANPKVLQGLARQLLQMRLTPKTLALTGVKEHDLEMQIYLPGKVGRMGIANAIPGYMNLATNFQDPADSIDLPAQNANMTLPAAFPNQPNRDVANLHEFYLWEINGPTFQIWNNGSAALTAGSIGVRVEGFRYDLAPLSFIPPGTKDANGMPIGWVPKWVYGMVRPAPPCDRPIVVVPTSAYQAQSGY
jgi:hypothetical protein